MNYDKTKSNCFFCSQKLSEVEQDGFTNIIKNNNDLLSIKKTSSFTLPPTKMEDSSTSVLNSSDIYKTNEKKSRVAHQLQEKSLKVGKLILLLSFYL